MLKELRSGRKGWLIATLLVILAFNQVDRLALGLVLQDIKAALHLSDTQLGVLTGIAFAFFYAIMGLPIARWADRGDRVKIISLTTALWSVAVVLSGIAGTFLQLLAIRCGVAVGEAGCIPTANSLIASHFPRAERPRAMSRYMLGGPLSVVIGYFVAGWLNELFGWRRTFMILGAPGLVLAALAWLILQEPRRAKTEPGFAGPAQPSFPEVCRVLWKNVTFRHLLFCFSVGSFFGYGIAQWQPAFFIRSFGLRTGELGTWFAVIYGLAGLAGTYLGGEWAARRAPGNERLQLKAMAAVFVCYGVVSASTYLSSSAYLALGFTALGAVAWSLSSGPLFATIQTLVPEKMRAQSVALLYLFANLIGMGLGPLAAGILSDVFRPWAGDDSLRYALLCLCPGYLWCTWHLWRASQTVTADLNAISAIPASERAADRLPVHT